MYHPAAILRTPTPEMRRVYEADFRKIPELLAAARQQPPPSAEPADEAPAAERADQLPLF
jgi:hypothetical protein